MTTRLRSLAALGATLALLLTSTPVPLTAQATLNTTTLAAALSDTSGTGLSTISLASASTVAVGQMAYVDREAIFIAGTTPTATVFSVIRGYNGTVRASHASGALVYTGPPSYFSQSAALYEPAGPCTAGALIATPVIYTQSGNIYQCSASRWAILVRGGLADGNAARLANAGAVYAGAGAIAVEPGLALVSQAVTYTLASPTTGQNGVSLCIIGTVAVASIITTVGGFNGGTTARDTATFGGAIGDGLCVTANGGVWYTTMIRNITFS